MDSSDRQKLTTELKIPEAQGAVSYSWLGGMFRKRMALLSWDGAEPSGGRLPTRWKMEVAAMSGVTRALTTIGGTLTRIGAGGSNIRWCGPGKLQGYWEIGHDPNCEAWSETGSGSCGSSEWILMELLAHWYGEVALAQTLMFKELFFECRCSDCDFQYSNSNKTVSEQ